MPDAQNRPQAGAQIFFFAYARLPNSQRMNAVQNTFHEVLGSEGLTNKNTAHVNPCKIPKQRNHHFRCIDSSTRHFGTICIRKKPECVVQSEIETAGLLPGEDESLRKSLYSLQFFQKLKALVVSILFLPREQRLRHDPTFAVTVLPTDS
jgi:hypothetical protein